MYIIHHYCFLIPNSPKKKTAMLGLHGASVLAGTLRSAPVGRWDPFYQSKEFPLDGQKKHVKIFQGKGASLA
jgi:hypothetical protein